METVAFEVTAPTVSSLEEFPPLASLGDQEATDVQVAQDVADSNVEMDADYALALQLQAQLDAEAEAEERVKSRPKNPLEKVTVSYYSSGGTYVPLDEDQMEEEEEDYDEEYEEKFNNPHAPVNYTGSPSKLHHQMVKNARVTKHDATLSKLENAQKLESLQTNSGNLMGLDGVSNSAYNSLRAVTKRYEATQTKIVGNRRDKSSHESGTVDVATRLVLHKLLNTEFLAELNGVLSVGKEAHVYHAIAGPGGDLEKGALPEGSEYAIKIYSTDIRTFKDRTKYVDGEHRFRNTPTQNNRKVIAIWAEKEMRNLKRLHSGGILCPTPVLLRKNIVIMSFIGKDGVPAPRLKDAELTNDRYRELYMQCIKMMRKMYQDSFLVHADLSEYNILYFRGRLWFIDVSQSVERDHPNALEFLRRDCSCISKFFRKKGITTAMNTRELFNFVTDSTITAENMDDYLSEVQRLIEERHARGGPSNEEQVTAGVFDKAYIPRSLADVKRPITEVFEAESVASTGGLLHASITGLKSDLSGVADVPEILEARQKELEKQAETKAQ